MCETDCLAGMLTPSSGTATRINGESARTLKNEIVNNFRFSVCPVDVYNKKIFTGNRYGLQNHFLKIYSGAIN